MATAALSAVLSRRCRFTLTADSLLRYSRKELCFVENRRLFIAILLSASILIVWNSIFPPVPPVRSSDHAPSEVVSEDVADVNGGFQTESMGEDPEQALERELDQGLIDFGEGFVAAEAERLAVLENESVRLEFSNRGAQLVSFRLKGHASAGGDSLELVRQRGSDPYPFGLVVDGDKSHRLNSALFSADQGFDDEGLPFVRFRYRGQRGLAEKVFSLTRESLVSVQMTVSGGRGWSVILGPGLRNLSSQEAESRFNRRDVGYLRGSELATIGRAQQEADEFIPVAGLKWATLEDNFFLVAVMPMDGVREIVVRPVYQRAEFREDKARFLPVTAEVEGSTKEQLLLVEASGSRMDLLTLFGDKRYSKLIGLPYGLEDTVRWGWFGFLAKPLYFALEWSHDRIVANYGWSIILVTCLIKILFLPLTYKSQESMGRMQELNPKVQAIKNKYRNKLKDKQGRPNAEASRQMNEEVMNVYKSAGVNPLSGCLPPLLQAPVFFAFFRLLSTVVELRNAPWIGWIEDLSVPDPIWLLPLAMGVTSVGLQKMMPSSPDPIQRRMFQLLPVMFSVSAVWFPSGLVLYWITNNILSMGQQALTNALKNRRQAAD